MRQSRAFGHVRPPNRAQIQAYADRHDISIDDEFAAQLVGVFAEMFTSLDVIDELSQPRLTRSFTDRDPGYEPRDDEDPYNAFIRYCTVRGGTGGPLTGLRAAIKDCIAVAGVPMSNGSRMLPQLIPTDDAIVVERLLGAGASIVGKTNMEDLAAGLGEGTPYGAARNPADPRYSAGGSSGGSAAAVASGAVDFALGGDEAGSIRIPASWCGVVGMKPTHGLVPSYGVTYMDHTLDHIGPLTAAVELNARVLSVIAGHDDRDPQWTRSTPVTEDYSRLLGKGIDGLRVGVIEQSLQPVGCTAETLEHFQRNTRELAGKGATVSTVSVPLWTVAWPIEFVVVSFGLRSMLDSGGVGYGHLGAMNVDAVATFASQLRNSANDLALVNKLLLIAAEHARDEYLGVHYAKAQNLRRELRRQVDTALSEVDILLTPTVPHSAVELITERTKPIDMIGRMVGNAVANTCPLDLTGHPALSVPGRVPEGTLPFGLQLIGPRYSEATLYRVGAALES